MRLRQVLAVCVVGVLAGAPSAATDASTRPAASPVPGSTSYSLLQVNACLSGLAPCLRYPQAVREVTAVIDDTGPDAVTLNEVCSGDVTRIAQSTGYHRRFSAVLYAGRPLPCIAPRGRGVFGNAVLTEAAVRGSVDRPFAEQSDDPEQRRWLCVTTARRVTVCATHLSAPTEARSAVLRQCAELAGVLARFARRGPTIAAGDVNRLGSCAPAGMWTVTDWGWNQKPGIQHVYGSARALRAPTARTLPARFTDHDFLYVTARLASPVGHASRCRRCPARAGG